MSEEQPVDVNSKTSLFKRLAVLANEDLTKGLKAYTSLFNLVFIGFALWQFVGPFYEFRGADNASAQVANMQEQISQAHDAIAHWKKTAEENKVANTALAQENAELSLKLDEALAVKKPEIDNLEPTKATTAALEPPILKTKVRRVPLKKKEDPSTCDQIEACRAFVTWYEKNVSAPAVPFVPVQP